MFPRRRSPRAFTLLEICIVLGLAVLLVSIAVPSLTGQMARKRLQTTFDRFDALAVQARQLSVKEGRPYLLVWQKNGAIGLYPGDLSDDARRKGGAVSKVIPGGSGEHYTLLRNSSLAAKPTAQWTFWPSGTCEPVIVRFESTSGEWEAVYNPLSGKGTFNRFVTR